MDPVGSAAIALNFSLALSLTDFDDIFAVRLNGSMDILDSQFDPVGGAAFT